MQVRIKPSKLEGQIKLPSSKSYAHRYIIIASFLNKDFTIENVCQSNDIDATINACQLINENISYDVTKKQVKITRNLNLNYEKQGVINVNQSGTTFRMLTAILSFIDSNIAIDGDAQLKSRNHQALKDFNINNTVNDFPIKPKLINYQAQKIICDATNTSQFVSGALIGIAIFAKYIKLEVKNSSSQPYIDLTLDVLRDFGFEFTCIDNVYQLTGCFHSTDEPIVIEGDMTHAVNFLVLKKYFNIEILNFNPNSRQADTYALPILNLPTNQAFEIDASNFPDSVAILALYAALNYQETSFTNIDKLVNKESNRISSTITTLEKFGVDIKYQDKKLVVKKSQLRKLANERFESYDDHRVVFLASVAALISQSNIVIKGAEAINKSYQEFFTDLKKLKGNIIYE